MVGDYFADFGEGDDCLERFVASLPEQECVHEPGLMLSYSNAGFNVAGRVLEAVCGKPFHEVLAEELFVPLGLRSTTVLSTEMLRFRYAVGHTARIATPPVLMYRSSVPAGGRTSATAADVLRFARLHIEKGRAADGSVVVSEEAVEAMRTPSLPLHGIYDNCHVGLGWMVWDWGAETCLFHTGGTIGQLAFLDVLPDRPFAVCLLTNADTGGLLWKDLGPWIFETFAGTGMPSLPAPPAAPPSLELERYAGSYEHVRQRFDVEARDDHLHVTIASAGLHGIDGSTSEVEARPIDERRFRASVDGADMIVTFLEPDGEGRPRFLHLGSRAAARKR
jgi:CubicO group peptidase (beta-lactamase class C family)